MAFAGASDVASSARQQRDRSAAERSEGGTRAATMRLRPCYRLSVSPELRGAVEADPAVAVGAQVEGVELADRVVGLVAEHLVGVVRVGVHAAQVDLRGLGG